MTTQFPQAPAPEKNTASNVNPIKPALKSVTDGLNAVPANTDQPTPASSQKKEGIKARLAASANKGKSAGKSGSKAKSTAAKAPKSDKKAAKPAAKDAKEKSQQQKAPVASQAKAKASSKPKASAKPKAKTKSQKSEQKPQQKAQKAAPAAKAKAPAKPKAKVSSAAKKSFATSQKKQAKQTTAKQSRDDARQPQGKKTGKGSNPVEGLQNVVFENWTHEAQKAQEKIFALQHESAASFAKFAQNAAELSNNSIKLLQENINALLETGNAAAKQADTLSKSVSSFFEKSVNEANRTSKALSSCKTPNEAVRIQNEATRSDVKRAIETAIAVTNSTAAFTNGVIDPLNRRVQKSLRTLTEAVLAQE
ncbi:MAG: hypothetical protein K0R63_328 [Rickettsiales bacterium]|jgi:hypothetical protein|nr:hypothetical protein [Rickettsiales bacterium]